MWSMKMPLIPEDIKEHLYDVLKGFGFFDKQLCYTLMDIFFATAGHVTVDELTQLLIEQKVIVEPALVQSALTVFVDFGFAKEHQFEGEPIKRYELVYRYTHHDHFICMKCKAIIEFTDEELESLQDSLLSRKGFRPIFHSLDVYGICDTCLGTVEKKIPITFAREGTSVTFSHVEGGGAALKKRLTELGFTGKETLSLIRNSHFGPIVLEVKGTRLAIGRGEAQRIYVFDPGDVPLRKKKEYKKGNA